MHSNIFCLFDIPQQLLIVMTFLLLCNEDWLLDYMSEIEKCHVCMGPAPADVKFITEYGMCGIQ